MGGPVVGAGEACAFQLLGSEATGVGAGAAVREADAVRQRGGGGGVVGVEHDSHSTGYVFIRKEGFGG